MTTSLPAAVSGERVMLDGAVGRLCVYMAGQGPALMLVHSVNAAASAAEVAPLHEHYRARFTVYSVDLPGYGHSDRSDRAYTPRLMTDALLAVRSLIHQRHGRAPFDALAVSLSCEFLARAAVESPADWRSLALVSPTGFNGTASRRGPPGSTRAVPGLLPILRGPGWGGALFRGLTRPGVIRYFLERTWGSKQIDEALWQYDVLTTRQPGAEHAPLHFLSAGLFSADVHDLYTALRAPVWMVQGVRGDFTDYRGRRIVEGRPNWRFTTLPTGAMPYFEVPRDFTHAYDAFLAAPPPADTHAAA
jgi:pimeloyl-ACP methyl ester carboxylesterase